MIDRDVKEALDLLGMEVHGQDPVGARPGDEVRHQFGRDGNPGLVLPVLSGVTIIG